MNKKLLSLLLALIFTDTSASARAFTKEAEYREVVKLVESYYHVKHKGVPVLANMGMKTAKVVSSTARKVMRFGDFKLAIFEDQDFRAHAEGANFNTLIRQLLEPQWNPLVCVRSQTEGQTYTYTRTDGAKFMVLIVVIGQRDGTVLQVDLNEEAFAKLLQDPQQESRNILSDATSADDEPQ